MEALVLDLECYHVLFKRTMAITTLIYDVTNDWHTYDLPCAAVLGNEEKPASSRMDGPHRHFWHGLEAYFLRRKLL